MKHPKETMVTVGDAIADFLRKPNIYMDNVIGATGNGTEMPEAVKTKIETWPVESNASWFEAVSTSTWTLSLIL